MKKILLSILVLVLTLCPMLTVESVAYAAAPEENTTEIKSDAYDFLEEFVTTESNNVADYEERQHARAAYLINKIKEIDNGTNKLKVDATQKVTYFNPYKNDDIENTVNIIVTKKAKVDTKKFIVVAANYDNFEGLTTDVLNSDGTTANAVGVATVLAIMKDLKDIDLSVNVEFVFFGANEANLQGSIHYVSQLESNDRLNDLLLMIDIWGIGAGDYNYIYDDEIHWDHYDYIYNLSQEKNLGFNKIPTDKKVIGAYEPNIKLDYVHQALLSDVSPFIAKRLPTISLYSGNYTNSGFVQSDRYGSILATSDDTFAKFNELFNQKGEAKQKMNNAVTLVEDLLKNELIESIMVKSITNKPDYSIFTGNDDTLIIITGVIVGLILLSIILAYVFVKKRADKSNDPIKPLYIDINQFVGPNGDIQGFDDVQPQEKIDPFGLDDDKHNNSSDNNANDDNNNNTDPFGL